MEAKRRQRDRAVSVSNLQSGCPRFESRSGDLHDLSSVISSSNRWTLCKKPTGCLLPVGVFNPVMYIYVYVVFGFFFVPKYSGGVPTVN